MKLAVQQSQEIARARQAIENMLGGKAEPPVLQKPKSNSERSRPSPTRSKFDIKTHFSEPPAPPPQAPLPEKPDVARALADPMIQPLLLRGDTARPSSSNNSPTRNDHSSDILRLCEELKLAKGELSNQSARMKTLEHELAQERMARESAEERAQRLVEEVDRRDSPTNEGHPSADNSPNTSTGTSSVNTNPAPEVQSQLDRIRGQMVEMKQQMEAYRQRAEKAETERDDAHQTLADMVEQRRRQHADEASKTLQSPAKTHSSLSKRPPQLDGMAIESNGHPVSSSSLSSPTSGTLMERAGVEDGQPITPEQAKMITQFLAQEVLGPAPSKMRQRDADSALLYYGVPYGSFAAVVLVGYMAMTYINGWPKLER
jgi:biotin carboxyl carrier protein